MHDVVALGELLIDFGFQATNPAGYPVLSANPGGAPGNFLAAVKKYGSSAAMIGKVGDDLFGQLLIHTLQEAGIDTEGVIKDPSVFTTMAFVTLDGNGNRDFSFARKPGADTCLRPDEINREMISGCKVFHFGTLSLTNEPSAAATRKALEIAKAQHILVSLDPNLRKPLWAEEKQAREAMDWSLHQADIVKISDEEVDFLWGLSPTEGADKLLKEYGVSLVYVTMGAKGCYAASERCHIQVQCPDGIRVVDTTGAGDIFGGSAMSRFLRYGKAPIELNANELTEIVRFACTAASLSTQFSGGISAVQPESDVIRLLNR